MTDDLLPFLVESSKMSRKSGINHGGDLNTPRWRKVRAAALRRDNGMCQIRKSKWCAGVADRVDHIVPRWKAPELAFEMSNLQSCCAACNGWKAWRDGRPADEAGPPFATAPTYPGPSQEW
jgi:5-methylcytosine-specific restriction endonuclease McrA